MQDCRSIGVIPPSLTRSALGAGWHIAIGGRFCLLSPYTVRDHPALSSGCSSKLRSRLRRRATDACCRRRNTSGDNCLALDATHCARRQSPLSCSASPFNRIKVGRVKPVPDGPVFLFNQRFPLMLVYASRSLLLQRRFGYRNIKRPLLAFRHCVDRMPALRGSVMESRRERVQTLSANSREKIREFMRKCNNIRASV